MPRPTASPSAGARTGLWLIGARGSVAAYAALQAGYGFVDFTPAAGARLPALIGLAHQRGVSLAGSDGKTGETLVKGIPVPHGLAEQAAGLHRWGATLPQVTR